MNIIRKRNPNWRVHPGEILREEFLKPMSISAYELAKRLHVPAPRVNDIVLERRGISADTAVRLSRFFGTTEQFWLNLQGAYEISRVNAERATEIALIPRRSKSPDHRCLIFPRGHRAITTVEIPPRGRNSPFTSAHTGLAQPTTSSRT
jgi:addiction module HigA family antidote